MNNKLLNGEIHYKKSDISREELIEALNLWNDEIGMIYPISLESFYQNIIDYEFKNVLLAYVNDLLIGFIFLKTFKNDLMPSYENNLYVSLFYVSRKYRNMGVGTKLFDFADEIKGNKKLIIGKDINNFFPGVPTDFDNLTDVFLEKRGYIGTRYTHDLIAYKPRYYEKVNKSIDFILCPKERKNELIQFMIENNWGRWAYEAKTYFESKEDNYSSYIIGVTKENKIVSFVKINDMTMNNISYNMMWSKRFDSLGGIGPLGVDKLYRHQSIGGDTLSKGIATLLSRGCKNLMIDWTGLMEVYRKYGFEVWKSYKYMEKNIENTCIIR